MKKRILVLGMVLALVTVLVMPAPVLAAGAATVSTPVVTLDEDATFDVAVAIDETAPGEGMELNAFTFDIVVNTGILTLDSVSVGTLIPGWTVGKSAKFTGAPYAGDKDWWTIAGYTVPTQSVSGDGELVVLTFTAGTEFDDPDSTVLHLDLCTLSDVDAIEIASTLTDGSATVDVLEVTGIVAAGDNTGTDEGYVTASDEATTFTMTPTYSGGSGTGYTYLWTFGDDGTGASGSPAPADVVYSTSGTKTISLRVTDSHGSDSEDHEIPGAAEIYDDLVADFSGTPIEGIVKLSGVWVSTTQHPSEVTFTDATAGGKATYTYAWDFDTSEVGADTSTVASPVFDYAGIIVGDFEGKIYEVLLTASDDLVASDAETKATYITIYSAGDVDGNLAFEAADVTMIFQVTLHMQGATYDFTSDVNDDGAINALDITLTAINVT